MKAKGPICVKRNESIIAESNDVYYYKSKLFPAVSISEVDSDRNPRETREIRHSFYDDIAKKYGIDRKLLSHRLQIYSEEVIRSLAVFGDHMYILDDIRIKTTGSY
jgi:hypothetical protein